MEEKVRVLIVDDSAFIRRRIRDQLEGNDAIVVSGEAGNGREAVDMAVSLNPDVITMDVAMPEMDGIAAVREIMRRHPTDILMLSALTSDGARATLDALNAGAVDFLAKHGCANGAGDLGSEQLLVRRVIDIANRKRHQQHGALSQAASAAAAGESNALAWRQRLELVVIGASTGGPVAIQQVLTELPRDYPYPLLVAVHMPAQFTTTFAERLNGVCDIDVALASDGDELRPATALIAPGGEQTMIERRAGKLIARVLPGGAELYKPCVDTLFGSAARVLEGAAQAVVMTGMGMDGTDGARLLKNAGARVWTQDQASSAVFGMPGAVARAGCSDRVLALNEIGRALRELAQ